MISVRYKIFHEPAYLVDIKIEVRIKRYKIYKKILDELNITRSRINILKWDIWSRLYRGLRKTINNVNDKIVLAMCFSLKQVGDNTLKILESIENDRTNTIISVICKQHQMR